jgi:adenylate cyclase
VAEPVDHKHLIDLLETYLLGEEPSLSGNQLADEVGIPFESARDRWRSLGFTEVGADVPAFTRADLEALRLTQRLSDLGFVEPDDESALIRTLGRSFARLAEWQMGLLARMIDIDKMDVDELRRIMDEVVPAVETLQSYVWRRHTLAVAARMLLAAERDDDDPDGEHDLDDEGVVLGVGFADIVNYTRQSRSLSRKELSHLIDNFESRALEIIGGHGGRIIKTIGDEILFVADGAEEIAQIGLELVEERLRDEAFPELRVGLAWGPALARLGDVLGPVVNVASRLTSTSRPNRVLVDRALADQLEGNEHFKLRRLRRTAVRGYRKLEPWLLRRPADEDPEISEDGNLPGPASSFLSEQTKGLFRGADEAGPVAERPPGGEGVD